MSSVLISDPAIHDVVPANYAGGMIARRKKLTLPRLFIREWMASKGLEQEEMADRMKCSPGTLSKLLNAKMNLTEEYKARIADALGPGVEVVDLYRHPDRPTQEDLLRGRPEAEQDRIIRAIRALIDTDI